MLISQAIQYIATSKIIYTNLLLNSNFAIDANGDGIADNWYPYSGTLASKSIGGNIQSFTAGSAVNFKQDYITTIGHIYFYTINVKTDSSAIQLNNGFATIAATGSGNFERLKFVHAATNTSNPNTAFQDTRSSGWTEVQLKEAMLIDLTLTYGAGKEPNLAWCSVNLPFKR